ncbi:sialate O-acetylesterase [Shewanella sp. GXUN23E]|uniref:sialate O-acetylesterase n=1 Tax=Shewanella sp. GXUN23E TaxID=3422498 RepID=UPI003D7D8E39
MKSLSLLLCLCGGMLGASAALADEGKHLFILSGQSNMARLDINQTFVPAVERKYGADGVIVVKLAEGGQPIRRWLRSWVSASGERAKDSGDLYVKLLEEVNQAVHGQPLSSVSFIWMQGEKDAFTQQSAVYKQSLQNLLAQVQQDLGREDVNLVLGRLSDAGIKTDLKSRQQSKPDWVAIRNIQMQFADEYPRGAWVDTDDLNTGLNDRGEQVVDDIHMTIAGYQLLGQRFADAAIGLIESKHP